MKRHSLQRLRSSRGQSIVEFASACHSTPSRADAWGRRRDLERADDPARHHENGARGLEKWISRETKLTDAVSALQNMTSSPGTFTSTTK